MKRKLIGNSTIAVAIYFVFASASLAQDCYDNGLKVCQAAGEMQPAVAIPCLCPCGHWGQAWVETLEGKNPDCWEDGEEKKDCNYDVAGVCNYSVIGKVACSVNNSSTHCPQTWLSPNGPQPKQKDSTYNGVTGDDCSG